jgi:agmatinase
MPASIINCQDWERAEVVLIGANFDRTSSFGKGADRGPQAIVDCLHTQIEFFDRLSQSSPAEEIRIGYLDLGEMNQLAAEEMVERLCAVYASLGKRWPLMLGGEHSVTNGPLRYYQGQAPEITVVQIDAHADLRLDDSDYNDTPWGRYAHCAVMRRAHELGYSLVQIGVRAYSADEREIFSSPRVKVFEWGFKEPKIEEIIRAIKTQKVYLSIDADGIDPAYLPATGTPVPGGLSWYYTLELIRTLYRSFEIVGADLVEVAPREIDSLTEYAAAQLVYSMIGLQTTKRR